MEELYRLFLSCGSRVCTDSRTLGGGELFFALRGENFDGNAFVPKALEAGAAYAVASADADLPEDSRIIRVPDTLEALQELAAMHRERVGGEQRLPVIGLTGTNGKTTTKELITAVLARKFRVTATRGNLNNDIGVPLSLLSITPETQIAVIEMGANHPDDIARLVKVSRPDYGLITNVGRAHLLGFGSFEGVKAAKGELYKWLGANRGSVIFLNEDDADLREMASREACHTFGYGVNYDGAEILPCDAQHPFLRLQMGGHTLETMLVGAYNAANVLAALAVGRYFGVPDDEAFAAIASYKPSNQRSQLLVSGTNTLVVDAYNANPSSMDAALRNIAAMECGSGLDSKLVMLGEMRELGADSLREHIKILRLLESLGLVYRLVGNEFGSALDAEKISRDGCWFPDSETLASALAQAPVSHSLILLKGSRGTRMEKVLNSL